MVTFNVLGSLSISKDGSSVDSVATQPRRVALLGYLVLEGRGRFIRRDTLLGVFWPELDQESARQALRQALYVLRRALGEDAIVSRGTEELAIDSASLVCDATVFLNAVHAGDDASAMNAYRGDLLPGFFIEEAPEFDRWLEAQRAELRVAASRSALRLAERARESGDAAGELSWLRRALRHASTDESIARAIVSALHRTGNRAEAVRAYEEFEASLRSEWSLEPSPETVAFVEAIRNDRTPRPPSPLVAPPLAAGSARPQSRERAPSLRRARPLVVSAAALGVLVVGALLAMQDRKPADATIGQLPSPPAEPRAAPPVAPPMAPLVVRRTEAYMRLVDSLARAPGEANFQAAERHAATTSDLFGAEMFLAPLTFKGDRGQQARAHLAIARLSVGRGQFEKAGRHLQTASDMNPPLASVREELSGLREHYLSSLAEPLRDAPSDADSPARRVYRDAERLVLANRVRDAARRFDMVSAGIEHAPYTAAARLRAARLYRSVADTALAARRYEHVIALWGECEPTSCGILEEARRELARLRDVRSGAPR